MNLDINKCLQTKALENKIETNKCRYTKCTEYCLSTFKIIPDQLGMPDQPQKEKAEAINFSS